MPTIQSDFLEGARCFRVSVKCDDALFPVEDWIMTLITSSIHLIRGEGPACL